jgi:hypothetical protein
VKSRDFSPDPRTGVKISAFPTPPKEQSLLSSHDLSIRVESSPLARELFTPSPAVEY